jgi:hypothetical protein
MKRGPRGRPRFAPPFIGAIVALLAVAPAAQATFHEMSIREVYPGGADNASYVELQMWAPNQNFVANHHLVAYNANGTINDDFKFIANVANGANQATVLVADTSYASVFPGKPAADAGDANLNLSPAGGAVCWLEGSPPDCVAWGDFTGPLPSHVPELKAGTPASPAGVPAGKALRRSIVAGCPTLLDPPPTDDSDDSAADFSAGEPRPRANASAIEETACVAPETTIVPPTPPSQTNSTEATFSFTATPAGGASFECRLDAQAFAACASPVSYTGLGGGAGTSHTFRVRAVHPVNGTDGTPATYTWTVDTVAPTAAIGSTPANQGPGNSAAFTYSSSENGSSFECSLEPGASPEQFSPCPSTGKSYPDTEHPGPLADGEWTFAVRATDQASNVGTPKSFSWTVDSSAADMTPPQTTIVARPPDPSASSTAFFSYESNEAGSSFECALDGAGFSPCPTAGVTYSGLANGPHTFQVRAIDSSANVDPTPAGYSLVVAAATPAVSAPTLAPAPVVPRSAVSPQTILFAKPGSKGHDRTPTFRFRSDAAGASFECAIDRGAFRSCRSPYTAKPLGFGRHSFSVRAVAGGLADPSPARFAFKVAKGG